MNRLKSFRIRGRVLILKCSFLVGAFKQLTSIADNFYQIVISAQFPVAQSARAVKYTNCTSAVG